MATSASRSNSETRCHSVASFFSPLALSFHVSVVAIETFVMDEDAFRLFYDRTARRADAVITISHAAKAQIVARLGVPSERENDGNAWYARKM